MLKLKSPAKVNLSLKVLGVNDGYHELEMTLAPINIYDIIKIRKTIEGISVVSSPFGPCGKSNLVSEACKYYFKKSGIKSGVTVEIEKHIPMGAGLGGGSSNAATTILALQKLFSKPIYPYDFKEIAHTLGADVPFFLVGKTSFVSGIGERISPTPLKVPLFLVVIFPGFQLSTADVFSKYDDLFNNKKLTRVLGGDISFIDLEDFCYVGCDHHMLINDLQGVANLINSNICSYVKMLIDSGASHALMSGSGSCVYGIYENPDKQIQSYNLLKKRLNDSKIKVFMAETLA